MPRFSAIRAAAFLLVLSLTACADEPTAPDRVLVDDAVGHSISADSLRSLTMGTNHTCGLDVEGHAWCWGTNVGNYVLGRNTTTTCAGGMPCAWRPGRVRGPRVFTHLTAGDSFTCGIEAESALVYCWGAGTLGNPAGNSQTPVRALAGSQRFAQIDAGGSSVCAVAETGRIWCWGYNGYGNLGQPDSALAFFTPTRVPGARTYTMVSLSHSHTCAIATTTAVYCWGSNDQMQIGRPLHGQPDGVLQSSVPTRVATTGQYTWISAGPGRTCAIRGPSAAVFCWGANHGVLNGTPFPQSATPLRVPSDASFRQVNAEGQHSCGLETTGHITCWGTGYYGVTGNGDSLVVFQLGRVAGTRTYTSLGAGGFYHNCASGAGSVYCWGANSMGQTGRDPATGDTCFGLPCARTPTRVITQTEFAASTPGTGRAP